jgi:D-alanyl-D-alanine dipeptidase
MHPLVPVTEAEFGVTIALAYASHDNFTRKPVYRPDAGCWLHASAAALLRRAAQLAGPLGLRLRILDAFRPQEAQWALWNHTPDPDFLADPRQGSLHSMGVAVDLDLVDAATGEALDMGTAFDAFTPKSHHGNQEIGAQAQRNRHLLLGIMTTAGWGFFQNEWWHFHMEDARGTCPLLSDSVLGAQRMMDVRD